MRRGVVSVLAFLALVAPAGAATIRGSPHGDGIVAQDGRRQTISCGRGLDVVTADASDRVGRDCETVSRQLATDTLEGGPGQHATIVEPDSAAFGRTIVAVYQVGRIHEGAAMQIGWATSRNAGATWRHGYLPALTIFSTPAGVNGRVSDPAVAYDAAHGTWLAATLAVSSTFTQLLVSRSPDGLRWSVPVAAATARISGGSGEDIGYDKEWIACDNGVSSPFRGHCYLSYTDFVNTSLSTQTSADGGLTWSLPVGAAPDVEDRVVGVQPASLPDGTLTIMFVGEGVDAGIWSVRSRDGGASFEAKTAVATFRFSGTRNLRNFPLPSAESAGGDVVAAWSDCRFRTGCTGDDLVVARTSDGSRWSSPARVPLEQGRTYVIPGLGVSPAGRLALAYYSLPNVCRRSPCGLTASFATTRGDSWQAPRRLSPQVVPLTWIAHTSLGRMVGDYISTSWVGGRPVSIFVLAASPRSGLLRESVFAYRG